MPRALITALLVIVSVACQQQALSPPAPVAVVRSLGTWQGRGSQTIGIVSESGRLRVTWEARREQPPGSGMFRLALHSGVSGRPIQLIVDQRGEGAGSTEVADDPRPYNFMVDSNNLEWSFSVEEIVAGTAKPAPESSNR